MALLLQVKPYKIPIYVSNNASTDNTVEVLSSFRKTLYPRLHFRSNDFNLGFDRNMLNAIGMASTKYVWLFGDRLRPLPHAVERVCTILSENALDLLVLNTDAQARLFKQERSIKNRRYSCPRQVLRELSLNAGTVGDQIVPLAAWNSSVLQNYIGKGWIHFAAIFEFLASLSSVDVMFTARPSITYSRSRSTWIPNWFELWDHWKATIRSLPSTYSEDDREFVIRRSAQLQFLATANLLNLRVEEIYNATMYDKYQEDLERYANVSLGLARSISRLPVSNIGLFPVAKHALRKGFRTLMSYRSSLNPLDRAARARRACNRHRQEKMIMHRFLDEVGRGGNLAISGHEVSKALRGREVKTLLLSEDLDPSKLEEFSQLAERTSTDVEIISTATKEGQLLKTIHKGVAAMLGPSLSSTCCLQSLPSAQESATNRTTLGNQSR